LYRPLDPSGLPLHPAPAPADADAGTADAAAASATAAAIDSGLGCVSMADPRSARCVAYTYNIMRNTKPQNMFKTFLVSAPRDRLGQTIILS
jgi:hypothetical protein